MRIYYDNRVDLSILDASSEVDGYAVENIQNPHRTRRWKTTGNASLPDEYVTIDAPTTNNKTHVILLDHDILAADTLKIQANSVPGSWGSPPFEETIPVSPPAGAQVWTTIWPFTGGVQTYQYWRLVWTKNTATQAYQVGRVFLGTYHSPEQGPDYDGVNRRYRDRSINQESYGGQIFSLYRPSVRAWRIDFSRFTETQKEAFRLMAEAVGTFKPFFVQIDENGPAEHTEPLYVRLEATPVFSLAGYDATLRYNTTLDLEESL